jgi:hypothetical protein
MAEDVYTSSVSTTFQLSFGKPLDAAVRETRLHVFRKTAAVRNLLLENCPFVFPRLQRLRIPSRDASPCEKAPRPEKESAAFADQRSVLIALRRAQRGRIYASATRMSSAIVLARRKIFAHVSFDALSHPLIVRLRDPAGPDAAPRGSVPIRETVYHASNSLDTLRRAASVTV